MEANSSAPVGRRRGRPGHLSHVIVPPAPKPRRVTSALDRAFDVLFPWPAGDYPGFWRGAAALLNASPWTVRDWRTGKRAAPQWALDALSMTLRKKAAEMIAAAEAIEKEKGRRVKIAAGHSCVLCAAGGGDLFGACSTSSSLGTRSLRMEYDSDREMPAPEVASVLLG